MTGYVKIILQIVALLLGMVNRHLKKRDAEEGLRNNEEFRKAMSAGDTDRAADLLSKRLRDIESNRAKRQGADIPPPDKP